MKAASKTHIFYGIPALYASTISIYTFQNASKLPYCKISVTKEPASSRTVSTIAVILTDNAERAFGDIVCSPPLDNSAKVIPNTPQINERYVQQIVEIAIMLNTTAAVVIGTERWSVGIRLSCPY